MNVQHELSHQPGPIAAEGAVFVDFQLTGHLPPDRAPTVIERDRLIMAARPGFNRKLLPLRVEPDSGNSYSGGRYLFDTYDNARAYARWVQEEFDVDGTLFFRRPDFADVSAQVSRVIGAHDFKDVRTSQKLLRTERWTAGPATDTLLERQWPTLLEIAAERDLASFWLLHNDEHQQVTTLTVADSGTVAETAGLREHSRAGICAIGRCGNRIRGRRDESL